MTEEWLHLQNDLQAVRTFVDNNPVSGLACFLAFIVFILFIFHFIFDEKMYPTKLGGFPLESLWARMIVAGGCLYFLLALIFKTSILLKLFFVIPVMTIAWFIYKD